MVSVPKEGHHVATALYIFSGWLLFNVLFAVGMYFRPVRKRAAGSTDDRTLEPGSNTRARFSEADQKWRAGSVEQGIVLRILAQGSPWFSLIR
jgi:hypothetical protein